MKIFICWAEERAKRLGSLLHEFIPMFIPGIREDGGEIFFSEEISKGMFWFDEVRSNLESSDAGIICVTPEGLRSGWLHFEAGALALALSEGKKRRIYPYLLGVEPRELQGPLSEVQATRSNKEDTHRLIDSIVLSMEQNAPNRSDLDEAFRTHWKEFEGALGKIRPRTIQDLIPDLEEMFRRKTFREPLLECTRQNWTDRFGGARETLAALNHYEPTLHADGSYLLDLYDELRGQVDGYAMDMAAFLLKERRFEFGADDGLLEMPHGTEKRCEHRRLKILQLVTRLLDPEGAPVLDQESRRFARMTTFEEKKALLIHPKENVIKDPDEGPVVNEDDLNRCASSWWEFDRIACFLEREHAPREAKHVAALKDSVEQELEKLEAVDGSGSLIPLHYAVRALKTRIVSGRESPSEHVGGIELTLGRVSAYLEKINKGSQIRENVNDVLKRLAAERDNAME